MKGSIFFNETLRHHQVSELNMSEHFLRSNIAFEILANLGLEPLSPRARLGLNLGPSPNHARNVYLVLNLVT